MITVRLYDLALYNAYNVHVSIFTTHCTYMYISLRVTNSENRLQRSISWICPTLYMCSRITCTFKKFWSSGFQGVAVIKFSCYFFMRCRCGMKRQGDLRGATPIWSVDSQISRFTSAYPTRCSVSFVLGFFQTSPSQFSIVNIFLYWSLPLAVTSLLLRWASMQLFTKSLLHKISNWTFCSISREGERVFTYPEETEAWEVFRRDAASNLLPQFNTFVIRAQLGFK